jgi:hypothetical protein
MSKTVSLALILDAWMASPAVLTLSLFGMMRKGPRRTPEPASSFSPPDLASHYFFIAHDIFPMHLLCAWIM